MAEIKCVGILTSGGDAPGMNAAIRAVTRSAIYGGLKVKGIYRGYRGLITDEIQEFHTQNVSNIIQAGGTILKTARCKEFTTPEGRQDVYKRQGSGRGFCGEQSGGDERDQRTVIHLPESEAATIASVGTAFIGDDIPQLHLYRAFESCFVRA